MLNWHFVVNIGGGKGSSPDLEKILPTWFIAVPGQHHMIFSRWKMNIPPFISEHELGKTRLNHGVRHHRVGGERVSDSHRANADRL